MITFQRQFQAFLIAVQFLTIVPLRVQPDSYTASLKYSPAYYPLVGLLIGVLLLLPAWLGSASPAIAAAGLLVVWTLITGALHIDGLADTADAWIGGHGDRDRTLAIMKDPASGPIAVAAIVLVLLLKYVTLEQLILESAWSLILIVPVLARLAVMSVIISVPYARASGLASVLVNDTPRNTVRSVLAISMLLLLFVAPLPAALGLLLVAAITAALVLAAVRRLGGMTGDFYGAIIELTEVAVLMLFVILS